METTERAYYAALFRRDYRQAQRLYRDLARTDYWPADRMVREGHMCGIYDDADDADDADHADHAERGDEAGMSARPMGEQRPLRLAA